MPKMVVISMGAECRPIEAPWQPCTHFLLVLMCLTEIAFAITTFFASAISTSAKALHAITTSAQA